MFTEIDAKSLWSYNPIPNGCQLYLPLWALKGNNFKSVDPYGRACTVTEAELQSKGRYFDGTNDLIDVGANTSLAFTGDFTIEAWINLTDTAAFYGIFNKYTAGGSGYTVYHETGGYLDLRTSPDAAYSYAAGLTAGWQHIAVVKAGNTATFYRNGVSLGDGGGVHNNVGAGVASARIGVYQSDNTFPFKGIIGEIAIYNRALSTAEQNYYYNMTKGRYL